ncbi:alpha/beta hydrolase family protein [Streptomyces sp. BI20]|uniref:alpha/beta hydrolase family protein n=1 Tax=Streptomyces sp. BI20 TaxID=3403460 RepID=UPI003C71E666
MRIAPRRSRRVALAATALAAATLSTACGASGPELTGTAEVTEQSAGAAGTARLAYDFGDTAYAPPGLDDKRMEMRAAVTYPKALGGTKHPLVVLLHGWGQATCADGDRPEGKQQWPCGKDTKPVDNHLGHGYLADALAAKGYVVVSVSANGIQAQEGGDGHRARAALLDKHLELWRDLADGKGGPLEKLERFSGHVDMNRVGTFGHSRGGGGVLAQALDDHKRPEGVTLRGAMAFAPALNGVDLAKAKLTKVPVAAVAGTCDAMWDGLDEVATLTKGNPAVERHDVAGGNHNFFNTVWSPGTGPAFATDDAEQRPGGRCESADGGGAIPRLTAERQRETAVRLATAFFDEHLK